MGCPALTSLPGRKESPASPMLQTPGPAEVPCHLVLAGGGGLPWSPLSDTPAGSGQWGVTSCAGVSFPVVSSDSDSDSDLSSSSLDDRLRPAGVRDPKGNKPWGESGGSVESLKMGPTCPASCLSGSQSSLASETGTGSADPQGGPRTLAGPRGPR
uniref:Uncharacterized protein n=1 Tax=Bos mutus grunniens TaxID=30521 RepID=A0A8B9XHI3_BOSMU